MDTTLFISFLIVAVGVIIIPGPNVLIIISTSLKYGKSRGLQTVAGTSLAMVIQLVIAGLSTSWFIQFLTEGFYIMKWLGVAYLLYLGLQHLKYAVFANDIEARLTASSTFSRGFLVSLTNPKTILFFSAFLPQFVSIDGNYLQQISILSVTFLVIAIILDSSYAILSAKFQSLLHKRSFYRIQNGFSGLLFLGASMWLATTRRVQ